MTSPSGRWVDVDHGFAFPEFLGGPLDIHMHGLVIRPLDYHVEVRVWSRKLTGGGTKVIPRNELTAALISEADLAALMLVGAPVDDPAFCIRLDG
jgi:hypothetical protein